MSIAHLCLHAEVENQGITKLAVMKAQSLRSGDLEIFRTTAWTDEWATFSSSHIAALYYDQQMYLQLI